MAQKIDSKNSYKTEKEQYSTLQNAVLYLNLQTNIPTISQKMHSSLPPPDSDEITPNLASSLNQFKPPHIALNDHINSEYLSTFIDYNRMAAEAVKNKKIFTFYTGPGPRLRKDLENRGWIEKCGPKRLKVFKDIPMNTLLKHARTGNQFEKMILSKLCNHILPNFIWIPTRFLDTYLYKHQPICNRIKRARDLNFTSKEGLLNCIERSHWHTIDEISEVQAPRCYAIKSALNNSSFIHDYHITYCLSLLKFLNDQNDPVKLFDQFGGVSMNVIKFAMRRIEWEMKVINNETDFVNSKMPFDMNKSDILNLEWDYFCSNVNLIIDRQDKFLTKDFIEVGNVTKAIDQLIIKAKLYWPRMQSDGYNNLWILKPSFSSRGVGIVIKRDLNGIIEFANRKQSSHYIVQKYIERPLLLFKTKFDIRQYVLCSITKTDFNIWMYKNCYLRFSSQEYQLSELTESVHITNNAVQRKYKNGGRSSRLPIHNMWSLEEFQSYLREIHKLHLWRQTIYPNMKKNIIAVVLTSLEGIAINSNSFELFGCDFILEENYEPVLLEINSNPDLSSSTIVTSKICPAVLEDLLKVVIDYTNDIEADTGDFELIYSINYEMPELLKDEEFEVIGREVKFHPNPKNKLITMNNANNNINNNINKGRKRKLYKKLNKNNNNNTDNNNSNKKKVNIIGTIENKNKNQQREIKVRKSFDNLLNKNAENLRQNVINSNSSNANSENVMVSKQENVFENKNNVSKLTSSSPPPTSTSTDNNDKNKLHKLSDTLGTIRNQLIDNTKTKLLKPISSKSSKFKQKLDSFTKESMVLRTYRNSFSRYHAAGANDFY